jgi:hypothetical protein
VDRLTALSRGHGRQLCAALREISSRLLKNYS